MLLKSNEDILLYLRRIGLDTPVDRNLDGLNILVRAQLTHVPFEALDVWGAGICPSLEIAALFEKIVMDHRGGYCFELNTLFRTLLNSLGFEAYQVIASLVDEHGVAAPPAHNGIICILDGEKYFVDVGFGGPVPFGAMKLNESVQYGFHFEKRGDFWYLFRQKEDAEINFIRFRDVAVDICELVPLNFYISQLSDVHFRHILRVNQRREDGSVYSLVDHELTLHTDEGTTILPVKDINALEQVLMEYFSIDIRKVHIQKDY